jgi:glycosyltransferase involved in cell wall biosynthesis
MFEMSSLRVAFVAGSLRLGGAEKQLFYQARALSARGADVRVYGLGRGEHFEDALRENGIRFEWVGRHGSPPLRVLSLVSSLRQFRPHVVQATHSFVNLYAAGSARATGAISLGALRGSLRRCFEANGRWGRWLMTTPTALVVNSHRSESEVVASGLLDQGRIHVLENAIDVTEYVEAFEGAPRNELKVMFVGTLSRVKRGDLFLTAVATARSRGAALRGTIVGDGPEQPALMELARRLDLLPGGVEFLGVRTDVPALLRQADMLVLSSDDEGMPNVVMEGMAAGLAVITTPVGDAPMLVQDGITGAVVPCGDASAIAERLVALSEKASMRREMGERARERASRLYGIDGLAERLLAIYRSVGTREARPELVAAVEASSA